MFRKKIKDTLEIVDEVFATSNLSYSKRACSFSLESCKATVTYTLNTTASALNAADICAILKTKGVQSKVRLKTRPTSPFAVAVFISAETRCCSTCSHWSAYDNVCLFSDTIDDVFAEMQGSRFGIAVEVCDDSGLMVYFKTGPDFCCPHYKEKQN